MEFLYITLLGVSYHYVVKIEENFWYKGEIEFGAKNPLNQRMVKMALTLKQKDRA